MNKVFALGLRDLLGDSAWSWVLPALHQVPGVWRSLTSSQLGDKALTELGKKPEDWKPAALGLLRWRDILPVELLMDPELKISETPLFTEVELALQRWKSDPEEIDLETAELVALGLRDESASGTSWDEIIQNLDLDRRGISTVFSCLFGSLPDPYPFVISLGKIDPVLGFNSLLSNPKSPEDQPVLAQKILSNLTLDQALDILETIRYSYSNLAAFLAASFAQPDLDQESSHGNKQDNLSSAFDFTSLSAVINDARLHQIAGDEYLALKRLEHALRLNRQVHAKLTALVADTRSRIATIGKNSNESGLEKAGALDREEHLEAAIQSWQVAIDEADGETNFITGLTDDLITAGRVDEAYNLCKQSENINLIFKAGRVAAQSGNWDETKRLAISVEKNHETKEFSSPRNVDEALELLIDIGFFSFAKRLAEKHLGDHPSDSIALGALCQAELNLDHPEEALTNALVALSIQPGQQKYQDLLIKSLQATGDHLSALTEFQKLIPHDEKITINQLFTLAHLALKAGKIELGLSACNNILNREPDNGYAHAVLGAIASADGDHNTALENLNKAVQNSPDNGFAWITLAEEYKIQELSDKMLETLRLGSQSAQSDPRIHLALGKAYLEDNSPSLAIAHLRQAWQIILEKEHDPENYFDTLSIREPGLKRKIALNYGQTLLKLGYFSEARQIYENLCLPITNINDYHPDLLHTYAQSLMACGEPEKALPLLEAVIQTSPDNKLAGLDYARSLLLVDNHAESVQQAVYMLESILSSESMVSSESPRINKDKNTRGSDLTAENTAEAFTLLAESLTYTGELNRAKDAYHQALDSNLINQPSWRFRLSLGLGQVALALNQSETAIAAFSEAKHIDPYNAGLYFGLSEAYESILLISAAYQAACEAIELDGENINALIWFGEQCLALAIQPTAASIQFIDHAIEILDKASKIETKIAGQLVKIAQLQYEAGDHDGSRYTYSKIINADDTEMFIRLIDLYQIALGFQSLDEPELAIKILERSIELLSKNLLDAGSHNVTETQFLSLLARCHLQCGNPAEGIIVLEKAHDIEPLNPQIYIDEAQLLLAMNEKELAQARLVAAKQRDPFDPSIAIRLSLVNLALGSIPEALTQARQAKNMINGLSESQQSGYIPWLVSELEHELLLDEQIEELNKQAGEVYFFTEACLYTELGLEQNNLSQAANYLTYALDLAPLHPATLALQARLVARQEGISETTNQLFESSYQSIENLTSEHIQVEIGKLPTYEGTFYRRQLENLLTATSLRELALAAQELDKWSVAMSFFEKILEFIPQSLGNHLHIARCLVLQGEAEKLCQALAIKAHAPGEFALSEECRLKFDENIQSIDDLGELWKDNPYTPNQEVIDRWRYRGMALFHPVEENFTAFHDKFTSNGWKINLGEASALISALGQLNRLDVAEDLAEEYPHHPSVQTCYALALEKTDPYRALLIAKELLSHLAAPSIDFPDAAPKLLALEARLADKNKDKHPDSRTALNSILDALAIWPDEPQWHSFAANLILENEQDDSSMINAVEHLQLACSLDSLATTPLIQLSKIYIVQGNTNQAIEILERVTQISPTNAEAWLLLARLQQATEKVEQALYSADRAVETASNPISAMLLRGELALQTNNPRGAQGRAQSILNLSPDHPEALYLLARALEALNQQAEALVIIEKALPLAEDPIELQITRARLIYNVQGPRAASQAYQAIVDAYPENPEGHAALAKLLLELGQPEAAIQSARQALQTSDGILTPTAQSELHFMIGSQLRRVGQLDQSIHHLSEGIRKAPDHLEYYLELGRAYQDRRQNAQALEIYQMASKIAPNDYRPYYQAGMSLKEIKDYQEAEVLLRRAAHLAPNEISIHRQLAAVVALNLVHNRRSQSTEKIHE